MMAFVRPPEPGFLTTRGPEWAKAWLERRAKERATEFAWGEYQNVPVNQLLLTTLLLMTRDHCAYCDHHRLPGDGSRATIDHFRPKSVFPADVCTWNNLFPSCDLCQQCKAEHFNDALLKPDAPEYSFERFFIFDFRSGELAPNPAAGEDDQQRARVTLDILGLNRVGRPTSRHRIWRRFYAPAAPLRPPTEPLDELPYRFLLTER